MSTLMEHIHRDADTTPVLPGALICPCAADGSGAKDAPAENDADSVRADLLPSDGAGPNGDERLDFPHEALLGTDPNEAHELFT